MDNTLLANLPLNHMQLFLDRVQALTATDIREAFARHLPASERVVITVGPPQPPAETEDNADQPSAAAEQEPSA